MPVSRSKNSKSATTSEPAAADQVEKDYCPEFSKIAELMCSNGAGDEHLAAALGVKIGTIKYWQAEHKDFAEACRELVENRVEQALRQRALGYETTERKLVRHGKQHVMVDVCKQVPAEVTAAFTWLQKRRPSRWGPNVKDDADDPFMAFLKQISGRTLQPVENPPPMREVTPLPGPGITNETTEDDEPPRLFISTDDNEGNRDEHAAND